MVVPFGMWSLDGQSRWTELNFGKKKFDDCYDSIL